MALDTEIGDTDAMIEDRFRRHRHAEIILSMPGFGVTLGAEFIAATGGDMSTFPSVDRLAGVSGLAPVPPAPRTNSAPKRAEEKPHPQAVLALARRRLNVLWAMLRDHTTYQPTAPNTA